MHYSRTEQAYVPWFVPSSVSTVCVTRQPWAAAKSRHFVLANERVRPASSGIGGCSSSTAGAVRICPDFGDRKTSAVAALAGGADRMKWFILGFLEGEHRLFAQLLYGTGMRIGEGLQLRVKDLISITATIIVRRARAPGIGPDVTRELGTQPARKQLSRARAWWLRPSRGRSGVALPTPLSGSIRAGHSGRGSGFCSTRIRPIHGGVVRRHHMRPDLPARLQTCRRRHCCKRLAMRQPLMYSGLTFKTLLTGAFRGDHHNKMPGGLCVVRMPQYL
nr:Integron integrase IntI1 [Escherichia coli O25b:H4-ST131]